MIIRAISVLLWFLILTNHTFSSSFPYYYEVTKDGKRFHVLGINYAVPFNSLPQDVQDSVLDHDSLVTESRTCFLDKKDLFNMRWIKHHNDPRNYFAELPTHYQEQLALHQDFYNFYQVRPEQLTPIGIYMFYQGALCTNGMLRVIEQHFKNMDLPSMPLEYQTAEIIKHYIQPIDITTLKIRLDLTSTDPLHHHNQLYMQGRIAEFPGLFNLDSPMVIQRHQEWPQIIEGHFNDYDNFIVAVGAAHLVGEHSILQELIKRGFDVKSFQPQIFTSREADNISSKASKKLAFISCKRVISPQTGRTNLKRIRAATDTKKQRSKRFNGRKPKELLKARTCRAKKVKNKTL